MAKRGDYCVAELLDGMFRPAGYRMARVVKADRKGFITNICFFAFDRIKPNASNTLGFHGARKTYAIPPERGDAVAHLLGEEWATIEETQAAVREATTRGPTDNDE